jgi:hypothetical protein
MGGKDLDVVAVFSKVEQKKNSCLYSRHGSDFSKALFPLLKDCFLLEEHQYSALKTSSYPSHLNMEII